METETANQEQELQTQALTIAQKFGLVKITDQPSYDYAANLLMDVKGFRKQWLNYWEPIRERAYDSYKGIMNKIKERDDPMAAAEGAIKRSLLQWDAEQRRLQEQRQAEAQRKAEADEEARRAQLAFEMEESGADEAEIEQVVSAPVVVVAPPVQTYQKASAVSMRDNWCIEIFDLKKLLKLIISGKLKIPAEDAAKVVEVFESILKPRAVADKETLNLDGCRAVNRKVVAGRVR